MNTPERVGSLAACGLLLVFNAMAVDPALAQDSGSPDPAVSTSAATDCLHAMRTAASRFLDSLSEESREQARFAFDDEERKRWSNLPSTMFERKGLSFGDMTEQQRVLAHRLIEVPLSSQGYLKVTGIMQLDEILLALARARGWEDPPFGHDLYWIGIFGDPASDERWGWQLDGHHLALNFTVVGGEISVTPAFLGTDPAEIRSGKYAGWRILGHEDDRARALYRSLDEAQRAKALIEAEAPRDVITGPGHGDRLSSFSGLKASEMRPDQLTLLIHLIHVYVENLEQELANSQIEKLREAGLDSLHFAWMGTEEGKPYYYRIHGPNLLIEFDNAYPPGQDAGPINHIHTVWRDPQNDYGRDLLRRHYEESPHHRERMTE